MLGSFILDIPVCFGAVSEGDGYSHPLYMALTRVLTYMGLQIILLPVLGQIKQINFHFFNFLTKGNCKKYGNFKKYNMYSLAAFVFNIFKILSPSYFCALDFD